MNSNVFPFGRWLLSKPEDLGSNPLMGNFTEYLLALFTFYWIENMKIEMKWEGQDQEVAFQN